MESVPPLGTGPNAKLSFNKLLFVGKRMPGSGMGFATLRLYRMGISITVYTYHSWI